MNVIYSEVANQMKYPFITPDLPYEKNDLEPYLSQETLVYHHAKHHRAYVDNLNKLLKDSEMKNLSLEDIIRRSHDEGLEKIFNNAAQVWNHTFYWNCMKKEGGGNPPESILDPIVEKFGSLNSFLDEFKEKSLHFGSGWLWLAVDRKDKNLSIIATSNAQNVMDCYPIMTCDLWEHAYYIDFRNRRSEYIDTFLNKLVDWSFAAKNYAQAMKILSI